MRLKDALFSIHLEKTYLRLYEYNPMKYMKGSLVFIWRIWMILIAGIYVIGLGLFVLIPLLISEKAFPYVYPIIRYWGKVTFYATGFRLNYEERVALNPNENYVFIANHTSMMDIMTVLTVLKHHPIVFVGKAELGKIPIFGIIYKRICISVDRSSMKSRAHVIPDAMHKLNQNLSIFIFPEGGVSDDLTLVLDKFKDGAFNIAIETQTPIAVLSIEGLKEMFPFDWFKGYPGKVHVKLLDIVPTAGKNTKEHKSAIKDYTYTIIRKELESCEK